MPYKPTGRKHGRPLKAVSRRLSGPQERYIFFKLLDPRGSEDSKLTGVELARKVGVTSAAISKWERDPIISEAVATGAAEYPELAFQIAEVLRIRAALKTKAGIDNSAFERALKDLNRDVEAPNSPRLKKWLFKNFQRNASLGVGGPTFETQADFADYMKLNKLVPHDWVSDILHLHSRNKPNQKK